MRHTRTALAAAALLAFTVGACGDDASADNEPAADAGITDVGGADSGDAGGADAIGDASADVESDAIDPSDRPPVTGPTTATWIARRFLFERENEPGIAGGFDLDGDVTSTGGDGGCGQADFVAPDGTEGIDNQFALLLPLVEAAGGATLPALIQSAINEGDLLIFLHMEGLDDMQNDDSVDIVIGRAAGSAITGADGLLQQWLTFGVDRDEPLNRIPGATIVDGVLLAGPGDVELPIFVFGFRFDVTLHDALVRAEMTDAGPESVTVGGSVMLSNILEIAETPGIQDRIPELIEQVGALMADMSVEDDCDALTAVATLELAPVFLFETP